MEKFNLLFAEHLSKFTLDEISAIIVASENKDKRVLKDLIGDILKSRPDLVIRTMYNLIPVETTKKFLFVINLESVDIKSSPIEAKKLLENHQFEELVEFLITCVSSKRLVIGSDDFADIVRHCPRNVVAILHQKLKAIDLATSHLVHSILIDKIKAT